MFWGSDDTNDWGSNINSTIDRLGVQAVLGFNEFVIILLSLSPSMA